VAREYAQRQGDPAKNWSFDPFVPDVVTLRGRDGEALPTPWEDVPTDRLAIDPTMWELTPGPPGMDSSTLFRAMR
jgi:ornithine decarboxylase